MINNKKVYTLALMVLGLSSNVFATNFMARVAAFVKATTVPAHKPMMISKASETRLVQFFKPSGYNGRFGTTRDRIVYDSIPAGTITPASPNAVTWKTPKMVRWNPIKSANLVY